MPRVGVRHFQAVPGGPPSLHGLVDRARQEQPFAGAGPRDGPDGIVVGVRLMRQR